MKIKHIGLRIDEETLVKLRYMAEYNGRSINRHVQWLIRKDIQAYEQEVEKIDLLGVGR